MKVSNLIEKLKTFDPDMDITVDGYEGGITEKFTVEIVSVARNVHEGWYYGEHEITDEGNDKVVNIGRRD